jgi:proteasome alpha subunit
VKRGTTCLGIVFKDGVLLATIKPTTPLMLPEATEKTFQIDDHVGAVAAGLLADARSLITLSRIRAQIHRITYDEPMDVFSVARVIGDRMQISTLYAGLRPYGVSFLIGGVDKSGVHLIEADPSGMLYEWLAYSIGRGAQLVNKIFKQKWREGMSEKEAIKLGLEAIEKSEKEKGVLEVAIIKKGEKFRRISEDEIKKIK